MNGAPPCSCHGRHMRRTVSTISFGSVTTTVTDSSASFPGAGHNSALTVTRKSSARGEYELFPMIYRVNRTSAGPSLSPSLSPMAERPSDSSTTHDPEPFVPFGKVIAGMDLADALNGEYGGGIRSWQTGTAFSKWKRVSKAISRVWTTSNSQWPSSQPKQRNEKTLFTDRCSFVLFGDVLLFTSCLFGSESRFVHPVRRPSG